MTVGRPESGLSRFFNLWFYNGLMVLACVVIASRALLVAEERPAWVAFAVATASWTFGEIWYAAAQPERIRASPISASSASTRSSTSAWSR